jgi:hypothetical protein
MFCTSFFGNSVVSFFITSYSFQVSLSASSLSHIFAFTPSASFSAVTSHFTTFLHKTGSFFINCCVSLFNQVSSFVVYSVVGVTALNGAFIILFHTLAVCFIPFSIAGIVFFIVGSAFSNHFTHTKVLNNSTHTHISLSLCLCSGDWLLYHCFTHSIVGVALFFMSVLISSGIASIQVCSVSHSTQAIGEKALCNAQAHHLTNACQ